MESIQSVGNPDHSLPFMSAIMTAKTDDKADDSWVDLSSQPSSSSLSSVADEIITTGLRVQRPIPRRRRRSLRPIAALHRLKKSTAGSSQDEYEETESESDPTINVSEYDVEDDDIVTTVATNNSTFQPQPNAFSHPPASAHKNLSIPSSNKKTTRPTTNTRHSYPSHPVHHLQHIHPTHQNIESSPDLDYEAALRASLSTLLSCAAARKSKTEQIPKSSPRIITEVIPTTIGFVSESSVFGEKQPRVAQKSSATADDLHVHNNNHSDGKSNTLTKPKSRSSSKERRAHKKFRAQQAAWTAATRDAVISNTNNMDTISPTLLTWVVGAGMIVIVSALSFSAGYTVGKEAGYAEVGVEVKRNLSGGKGSGLGLRKWTGAAVGITSA